MYTRRQARSKLTQVKILESAPKELLENPELLFVGTVVAAHGIKGALRVKCNERVLDKFMDMKEIIPAYNEILPPIAVQRVASVKNTLLLFLEDIETKEAAEELVHHFIFGKQSEIARPEADEWWVRDLIGLDVYTTEGVLVGTICDVISTGADLLEVRSVDPAKKDTFYIPFVKEIVPGVHLDRRRVEINAIPGLLDL